MHCTYNLVKFNEVVNYFASYAVLSYYANEIYKALNEIKYDSWTDSRVKWHTEVLVSVKGSVGCSTDEVHTQKRSGYQHTHFTYWMKHIWSKCHNYGRHCSYWLCYLCGSRISWSQSTSVSRMQSHVRIPYVPKHNVHPNFEGLSAQKFLFTDWMCKI
jgi:hypothetical protein